MPKTLMQQAREFTEASGTQWPAEPRVMTQDEIDFVTRMVVDELLELGSTVYDSELNKSKLIQTVRDAKSLPKESEPRMEDMADSLADIIYYSANAAAKVGYDLDSILEEVHEANMRKRGPDGIFIKNASGKVLKPKGWCPPDIKSVMSAEKRKKHVTFDAPDIQHVPIKRPGTEVFSLPYPGKDRISDRVAQLNRMLMTVGAYMLAVMVIKFYKENVVEN